MGVPLGHGSIAAFKVHTNAWGNGLPVAAGAGDGFEFDSDSIKANSQLIKTEGNYGGAYRRAGVFGALKPGGAIPFDLYYQCAAWRLICMAIGADAVTSLGGSAYRHDITVLNNHAGKYGTLVIPMISAGGTVEGVMEIPHAKISGVELSWNREEGGKVSCNVIGFDENLNIGAANAAFVVASITIANGPQTVLAPALADFTPSPLSYTKTGTTTALNVTIVYVDRFNIVKTITITETDFVANVWTGIDYARRVISVTVNSFTGAAAVSAGVSNGINGQATVAAITTAVPRDRCTFPQMRFYAGTQGGGAFAAADEYFLENLKVTVDLGMDQRVTTQFQSRVDEPSTGAQARPSVKVALNYSALTTANKNKFFDMIAKNQIKAEAILTGPSVAGGTTAQSLAIWLNAIQFDDGEPDVSGPGVLPFTATGEAQRALAVPTGFPGGDDQPIMLQLVNGLSTVII